MNKRLIGIVMLIELRCVSRIASGDPIYIPKLFPKEILL